MQSADYNKIWHSCFEKTECIITADGSNDTKTNPEGLINHIVPKHLPAQVSEDAINCLVYTRICTGARGYYNGWQWSILRWGCPKWWCAHRWRKWSWIYDHIMVIVKYVLFMTIGGTKGPFNGIIKKYIYIRCCSTMEMMTI